MTKIFLIPHWAIDVFHRHEQDASSILDVGKVRQYLSLNDAAGILAVNDFAGLLLGTRHADFSSNIIYEWSVSATPNDATYVDKQLAPLSKDASVVDMVRARLFQPEHAVPFAEGGFASGTSDQPYEIIHLSNGSIGVVLKAHGLHAAALQKWRLPLVRDIVKQLYVYESQPAVARLPLYLRYVELLQSM